jgi:hypothetical protein
MQVGQSDIAGPPRRLQFGMAWLCGLLGMLFLGGLMSLFDHATQIAPAQDGIQDACMAAAGAVALLSAATGFWQLSGHIIAQRVIWAAIVAMLGFFGSSAFLFYEIASFVEGWMDFPPGTTRTAEETTPITYAYQHHGRHANIWNVEVRDAFLRIAPGDADFMLNRRRPGDTSGAWARSGAGGYFCAKVTIQRAGNAKRVLHTGGNGLPPGSVMLCPKANVPLAKRAHE